MKYCIFCDPWSWTSFSIKPNLLGSVATHSQASQTSLLYFPQNMMLKASVNLISKLMVTPGCSEKRSKIFVNDAKSWHVFTVLWSKYKNKSWISFKEWLMDYGECKWDILVFVCLFVSVRGLNETKEVPSSKKFVRFHQANNLSPSQPLLRSRLYPVLKGCTLLVNMLFWISQPHRNVRPNWTTLSETQGPC